MTTSTPNFFPIVTWVFTTLLASSVWADDFGSGDDRFRIEFVTIAAAGNPPHLDAPANPAAPAGFIGWLQKVEPSKVSPGFLSPRQKAELAAAQKPIGRVEYVYRIGKFEVSRDAVARANSIGRLGITLSSMAEFSRAPSPHQPATGVSWNEAARFVNWLNRHHGYSGTYRFRTEPGDPRYDPNEEPRPWPATDPGYDDRHPLRHRHSKYFLPDADEWYKAAAYAPPAAFGRGHYWVYPTGRDTRPVSVAGGTSPGTAVYNQDSRQGPAAVFNAGGPGPWGAVGMGGNVWEWVEPKQFPPAMRGGAWNTSDSLLSASTSLSGPEYPSTIELVDLGFRVASR